MVERPGRRLLRSLLATVLLIAAFLMADTGKPKVLIWLVAPILTFVAVALIVDESTLRVESAINRLVGSQRRNPDWHQHEEDHPHPVSINGHIHSGGRRPHRHETLYDD